MLNLQKINIYIHKFLDCSNLGQGHAVERSEHFEQKYLTQIVTSHSQTKQSDEIKTFVHASSIVDKFRRGFKN